MNCWVLRHKKQNVLLLREQLCSPLSYITKIMGKEQEVKLKFRKQKLRFLTAVFLSEERGEEGTDYNDSHELNFTLLYATFPSINRKKWIAGIAFKTWFLGQQHHHLGIY